MKAVDQFYMGTSHCEQERQTASHLTVQQNGGPSSMCSLDLSVVFSITF